MNRCIIKWKLEASSFEISTRVVLLDEDEDGWRYRPGRPTGEKKDVARETEQAVL